MWRNNRIYDELNVPCSCSRCYHNPKCSLVIMSTLVLRLKADESFQKTSRCKITKYESLVEQKNLN